MPREVIFLTSVFIYVIFKYISLRNEMKGGIV